ncbi:MAG TPA: flagellar hook capping FlgD N-terminal domain-containing protein [Acidimicrobiales bacterium]|jgi:flagellar basal-body rod modification protein FlgD|nr:flagellar hook capping FlgD N-terminal domain-containing protein [Acidimicrobiales bacterium]
MTTPIDAITAVPSAPATSAAASSPTNALLQPNEFLTLLIDNLKYQDPLDPTNSAQFLGQLAQLAQVETLQQLETTDASASQAAELANATALVGRQVSGTDAAGHTVQGVVSGVSDSATGPVLEVGSSTLALGEVATVS